MRAEQKATILDAVVSSTLPKRQALRDLGVPKSTYYRWLNRHRLDDRPGGGGGRLGARTSLHSRSVSSSTCCPSLGTELILSISCSCPLCVDQ